MCAKHWGRGYFDVFVHCPSLKDLSLKGRDHPCPTPTPTPGYKQNEIKAACGAPICLALRKGAAGAFAQTGACISNAEQSQPGCTAQGAPGLFLGRILPLPSTPAPFLSLSPK